MKENPNDRNQEEITLKESDERYRFLYDFSPVALAEGTCFELRDRLEALRKDGITDFRTYFEEHPEAVAECMKGIQIVDVNDTMVSMLRASSKAQLLGHLDNFFADESVNSCREGLVAYAEGRNMFECEIIGKTVDGEKRHFMLRWAFVPGFEESRTRTIGSFLDISERKQADEELRKFKTISDQSNIGNALFDSQGNFIYANETLARMHGYEVEEILGKHFSIFHTEEQLQEVVRLEEELASLGSMENIEIWHKRKDGTVFPMLVNVTLIKDGRDNVSFYSFSGSDITRRKKVEGDLKKFKAISDAAMVGNTIIDNEGVFQYVNHAFAAMHGYRPEELLDKPFTIVLAEEEKSKIEQMQKRLLREGAVLNAEFLHKRRDGSVFPGLVNATVIRNENGIPAYLGSTTIDISARKEMEVALRAREEDLEARNIRLDQMNAALKVLISNREKDKKDLEEKVLTNVRELSLPILEKLRGCKLDARESAYMDVLESSLNEIISPFLRTLSAKYSALTQAELMVATMVKEGSNTKKIASIMGLSERSVETYRTRLRKKLGIGNRKVNLRTFLLSFQ